MTCLLFTAGDRGAHVEEIQRASAGAELFLERWTPLPFFVAGSQVPSRSLTEIGPHSVVFEVDVAGGLLGGGVSLAPNFDRTIDLVPLESLLFVPGTAPTDYSIWWTE